jgi:cytochrome c biogenesis protein
MAHNTTTHELAGGPVPAPGAATHAGGAGGGVDSALEWLWHVLTSMKLALVLLLVFAALSLVGTLVIQAPAGVMDNPQARTEWLASIRPRFGGWTDLMERLQVFAIFGSIWVRAIGALLLASVVACTVHRIPGTWRTTRKPRVNLGPAFFEHAPQHEAMTFQRPPEEVLAEAKKVFKRHHYRTITEDDGSVHLYAVRNNWAPWAGLVAHFSIVIILAGAMLGAIFGFRNSEFILAEGATSAVPTRPGATITLNSFQDTWDPNTGQPLDYVSDVTVSRDGQVVAQQLVRVNEPLRYDGISFFQAFYGPAAVMTVKDAAGATIFSGGVPLSWTANNGGNKVGSLPLSGQTVTAWIVATSGPKDPDVKPGQVAVELYETTTGNAVVQKSIDLGVPTTIEGLSFTFDRETKFTGLAVANDPGTPIVWVGSILLIVGFMIRLYVPHRRVWGLLIARPGGSSLSIAAVGRRDSSLDAEFTSLVTDIREAMSAQARS